MALCLNKALPHLLLHILPLVSLCFESFDDIIDLSHSRPSCIQKSEILLKQMMSMMTAWYWNDGIGIRTVLWEPHPAKLGNVRNLRPIGIFWKHLAWGNPTIAANLNINVCIQRIRLLCMPISQTQVKKDVPDDFLCFSLVRHSQSMRWWLMVGRGGLNPCLK